MPADRPIHMAHQAGKLFATQDANKASGAIAEHFRKFRGPHMRKQIRAYFDSGGKGLVPLACRAVEMIAAQQREVANASTK